MPRGAYVFTSNVDGQFQRAGFPDERVVEVHGGIGTCSACRCAGRLFFPPAAPVPDGDAVAVDPETCRAAEPLPRIVGCGALARPNILMFNDGEWLTDRYAQQLGSHARLAVEATGPESWWSSSWGRG